MPRYSPPPELDFERLLPAGQQWFSACKLARHWDVSVQHIIDLINEGRFTYDHLGPVDLSGEPGRTRATTRIPRACIIAFLKSHQL